MITTVTTTTTAIITTTATASLALIAILTMLLLLINKEIILGSSHELAMRLNKIINIAILPLAMVAVVTIGLQVVKTLR